MSSPPEPKSKGLASLHALDRAAVTYLTLPLLVFLLGWFEWWVALPLTTIALFAMRHLAAGASAADGRQRLSRLQVTVAVAVGSTWAVFGGADHLLFANADWHVRDAVLHDLVSSPWPVGYGSLDGHESLLRAPVAFYLPAALVGKLLGLGSAHVAMGLWTALGAALFILQVLSLVPSRGGVIAMTVAVVVLFSGFDIIGNLINTGPRFVANWSIAQHLEWWAGAYQYSSMTTQLFWVPNHALGGWLMIGMMARNPRYSVLDTVLPIVLVSAALWSPLSALGVVPFAALRLCRQLKEEHRWSQLHPQVWAPALIVGIPVAAYLVLDPAGIPKGVSLAQGTAVDSMFAVLNQLQFFLLEAGFIGLAVWSIHRSAELLVALIVLALLPAVHFGPYNDLAMRGSIPSIAVLAIGACLALADDAGQNGLRHRKIVLLCLLAVGAVTAVQEFARAVILDAWPINLQATLIGASCGTFPPHYTARLGNQAIHYILRAPHRLSVGLVTKQACLNPAVILMYEGHLL